MELADGLFRREEQSSVQGTVSYVIFRWEDPATKAYRFMSPPIFMSPESLRLRLDSQGRTKIYIDRDNVNNYFFDLRFLENTPM